MKSLKPFFMALFGTFIEYYDYALYGFSAPIIAQQFFPKEDPIIGLLQTYGIFIVGSCSKPLGSLFFGYLGDRYGRAYALKISICGIAVPTFLMGLLPNYSQIGYLAPLGLLICRIFQGIFVSGESDTARVFLYEMLPEKFRCMSSSMAYFICMIGIYASSLAGPFVSNFAESQPFAYWRIPFLLGGIFGLILFVLRRNLQESEEFLKHLKHQNKQKLPIIRYPEQEGSRNSSINAISSFFNFSKNGRAIFITILLTGAAGGQYHFYFVFLNQYLSQVLKQYDLHTAAMITSNLLLCFALLLPFAGLLADRLKQYFNIEVITLLKKGSLFLLIVSAINMFYVSKGSLPKEIMILTVLGLAFTHANTFVVILSQFEIKERCRSVSIGHSLGSMILSGSAPFLSLGLWKITEWQTAPLFYFILLCSISFFGFRLLDRTANQRQSAILKINEQEFVSHQGIQAQSH